LREIGHGQAGIFTQLDRTAVSRLQQDTGIRSGDELVAIVQFHAYR
jgi:hypothetical protein